MKDVKKIDVLYITDSAAIDVEIDQGYDVIHQATYSAEDEDKALKHARRLARKYGVNVNIVEDYPS